MARYFFHTANGNLHRDGDGLELATDRIAELEAIRFLGALLAEQPETLSPTLGLTVTVTDTAGQVTFSVRAGMLDANQR